MHLVQTSQLWHQPSPCHLQVVLMQRGMQLAGHLWLLLAG